MAKKYCTKCGAELPDNVKFCPNCGNPILPAEDNMMDPTEPVSVQNTTSVPDFHADSNEDTQNMDTSSWSQQSSYAPQDNNPYNNPDYVDDYEEQPKKHVGLIILIIVIAVCVAGFFFLLFAKPEFLTDTLHLPFGNKEAVVEKDTSTEETAEPKKKETTKASEEPEESALPEKTSEAKATPKPTSGVLKTTDDNTKTVTPAQQTRKGTGTVYISASANPRRIRVRTAPSQSATDTGARKYDGDVVTVYETRQAEGYTWYRIGDNQWIAGNGSSFGVSMN